MIKNPHAIEYEMTKKAFDAILATRNEMEKRTNPYTFVMGVLNEQNGLRGTVKKIHVLEH